MGEFSAVIEKYSDLTKQEIEVIFLEAAQALWYDVTLSDDEGGRMPIDTGFLRASGKASLNQPINRIENNPLPPEQREKGKIYFKVDAEELQLVLLDFALGDTIYFTFSAAYARHQEYGTKFQKGKHFVSANVANWQNYVNAAAYQVVNR